MKPIFIEGVSGIGKSTTTVTLCNALNNEGFRAICYLEGETDNPVDLYNCAYLTKTEFSQLLRDYPSDIHALVNNSVHETDYTLVRYGDLNTTVFSQRLFHLLKTHEGFYKPENPISLEQYTMVFVDCWRRFLCQDLKDVDYVIFDGCILFHRINDLIQIYQASNDLIITHLKALLSVVNPYNPFLFYLSSNDVGTRLNQARKSRGQAQANETRIALEIERKYRQIQIMELLPIKAHVFDISDDWTKANDDMMKMIRKAEQ